VIEEHTKLQIKNRTFTESFIDKISVLLCENLKC